MTAPDDDPRDELLRAWAAQAARDDPDRRRFGARHHDYRWRAPLSPTRIAAIERELGCELPASYRRVVTAVGDGGVGPYYGLMALDHPVQLAAARGEFRSDADDLYRGVIGLGHVGCSQIAFLIIRSGDPAAGPGEVWVDARAIDGGVVPIAPDFDLYLASWIHAVAHHALPRGFVDPATCALARVLSTYLEQQQTRAGVARLSDREVRDAFGRLPIDAIRCRTSGGDPFFVPGDLIDPCIACEVLLANLGAQGLPRDRVARGENPLPGRRSPA